jgi:hypothetical protein
VKVLCRVNNTYGDTAYDIYEFYVNDSPVMGNISVTFEGGSNQGITLESVLKVNLTNWYDSSDDTTQKLNLNVYGILT